MFINKISLIDNNDFLGKQKISKVHYYNGLNQSQVLFGAKLPKLKKTFWQKLAEFIEKIMPKEDAKSEKELGELYDGYIDDLTRLS